jgi:ADP-ribose pyrophosphatase YjhB (NUDIX family)
LDVLPVPAHHKRGKYVGVHLHLSVAYVFEVSETELLRMKPDENSGVSWFPLEELAQRCTEPLMLPVYQKLITYGIRYPHE